MDCTIPLSFTLYHHRGCCTAISSKKRLKVSHWTDGIVNHGKICLATQRELWPKADGHPLRHICTWQGYRGSIQLQFNQLLKWNFFQIQIFEQKHFATGSSSYPTYEWMTHNECSVIRILINCHVIFVFVYILNWLNLKVNWPLPLNESCLSIYAGSTTTPLFFPWSPVGYSFFNGFPCSVMNHQTTLPFIFRPGLQLWQLCSATGAQIEWGQRLFLVPCHLSPSHCPHTNVISPFVTDHWQIS